MHIRKDIFQYLVDPFINLKWCKFVKAICARSVLKTESYMCFNAVCGIIIYFKIKQEYR